MTTATIQTNSVNDFFVDENNNLVFLVDIYACAQDTRSNALMRRAENIYNVNEGVGYFEFIFTPQQSYDEARKSLATALSNSPDVVSIEKLDITIDGENFNFEAVVVTSFGLIKVVNR